MARLTNEQEMFVIMVKRGNSETFIAKHCFTMKHHVDCTIVPNKAKRFPKESIAFKFWNDINGRDPELTFAGIKRLQISYQISDLTHDGLIPEETKSNVVYLRRRQG